MNIPLYLINKLRKKIRNDPDYTGERVVPTEMHGDVNTWIQHLNRYVYFLKYVVHKKTLDVACGTGYGTSLLSSVANNVVGIDINERIIKWAKYNNSFYCPVSLMVKNLDEEELQGKYDTIICFETIEHLKKPDIFLEKLKKVTNPNGIIIFSVPLNEKYNKFHKTKFNWRQINSLIKKVFINKIKWFSQLDQCIIEGIHNHAKFAIGMWKKE